MYQILPQGEAVVAVAAGGDAGGATATATATSNSGTANATATANGGSGGSSSAGEGGSGNEGNATATATSQSNIASANAYATGGTGGTGSVSNGANGTGNATAIAISGAMRIQDTEMATDGSTASAGVNTSTSLSSGTVEGTTQDGTTIDIGESSAGTFSQSGGSLIGYTLNVHSGSTYALSGGTLSLASAVTNSGTITLSGGTASMGTTGTSLTNNGTFNYTGGSLTANVDNYGTFYFHNGATRTITGNVINEEGALLHSSSGGSADLVITGSLTNYRTTVAHSITANSVLVGDGYVTTPYLSTNSLEIDYGAVHISQNATKQVIVLNSLIIGGSSNNWNGVLDLNNNDLIVHAPPGLAESTEQIAAGDSQTAVPEPGSLALIACGGGALMRRRRWPCRRFTK